MLSRIAESLFWIGRYVERADDTSRILDVHVQLLSEDPWAEEDLACRALLTIMDRARPADGTLVTKADLLDELARDPINPSAIVGSLLAARENARRAREIVSTELWETLNTTRNEAAHRQATTRPHEFFAWVRERASIVAGLQDSSTRHDDAWRFMILGRALERADMTARLLTAQAQLGDGGPGWTALLRSCGGYEAFLKTYRGAVSDARAAVFLLSDRLFPRSIVAAVTRAETIVMRLDPSDDVDAVPNEARRVLGAARAAIEYAEPDELVATLPDVLAQVQRSCAAASESVRQRYFPSQDATWWTGEAL